MKANIRSICGATLMLAIIPMLAGLLACMPVPIGDPERSRIDPKMSGWWVLEEDGGAVLCVLRPYDKRTWMVISVDVGKGDAAAFERPEITTGGDLLAVLRRHEVGQDGIVGGAPAIYKAWLTRLGGRRFMTWEPVGMIDDPKNYLPEVWLVFGVTVKSEDDFVLAMLDSEYDAFDGLFEEVTEKLRGDDVDVWKARKRWERVIRKHADDPDLYDSDTFRLRRLPGEFESKAARLIAQPFDYQM